MYTIECETYSAEAMVNNLNSGMRTVLLTLNRDGVITNEQLSDYWDNCKLIIEKPSRFSRFWNKVFRKTGDKPRIIMVRQVSMDENLDEEPKE
jgi:hypothetical protein